MWGHFTTDLKLDRTMYSTGLWASGRAEGTGRWLLPWNSSPPSAFHKPCPRTTLPKKLRLQNTGRKIGHVATEFFRRTGIHLVLEKRSRKFGGGKWWTQTENSPVPYKPWIYAVLVLSVRLLFCSKKHGLQQHLPPHGSKGEATQSWPTAKTCACL